MKLCPVCGPDDAPRPTGAGTMTYNGVTHKTRECAAMSSVGETPIRTADGYRTKSGLQVCMDCFDHGHQHTYADGEDLRRQHERGFDPRRRHD